MCVFYYIYVQGFRWFSRTVQKESTQLFKCHGNCTGVPRGLHIPSPSQVPSHLRFHNRRRRVLDHENVRSTRVTNSFNVSLQERSSSLVGREEGDGLRSDVAGDTRGSKEKLLLDWEFSQWLFGQGLIDTSKKSREPLQGYRRPPTTTDVWFLVKTKRAKFPFSTTLPLWDQNNKKQSSSCLM